MTSHRALKGTARPGRADPQASDLAPRSSGPGRAPRATPPSAGGSRLPCPRPPPRPREHRRRGRRLAAGSSGTVSGPALTPGLGGRVSGQSGFLRGRAGSGSVTAGCHTKHCVPYQRGGVSDLETKFSGPKLPRQLLRPATRPHAVATDRTGRSPPCHTSAAQGCP